MPNPTPAWDQQFVGGAASIMELTDQLAMDGRTLVFCDDTDVAEQPVATLQPDLRILVAVQVLSENYATLDAAMVAALDQYGVPEFHATDMTPDGPRQL